MNTIDYMQDNQNLALFRQKMGGKETMTEDYPIGRVGMNVWMH